jgi:hypothetical protein
VSLVWSKLDSYNNSYSIDVEEAVNGACSRKFIYQSRKCSRIRRILMNEVNLACFANDVNGNLAS